jgi:hypothetical protein
MSLLTPTKNTSALNSIAARLRILESDHLASREDANGGSVDTELTAHIITAAGKLHGELDRSLGSHHHSLNAAIRACRDRLPEHLSRRLLRLAASASAVRHVSTYSLEVLLEETFVVLGARELRCISEAESDPMQMEGMDPWATAASSLPSRRSPSASVSSAAPASACSTSGSVSGTSATSPCTAATAAASAPAASSTPLAPAASPCTTSWGRALSSSLSTAPLSSGPSQVAVFVGGLNDAADFARRLGFGLPPGVCEDHHATADDIDCRCGLCNSSWFAYGWKCLGRASCSQPVVFDFDERAHPPAGPAAGHVPVLMAAASSEASAAPTFIASPVSLAAASSEASAAPPIIEMPVLIAAASSEASAAPPIIEMPVYMAAASPEASAVPPIMVYDELCSSTVAAPVRPSVGEMVARLEPPKLAAEEPLGVLPPIGEGIMGDVFAPWCGCGARMVIDLNDVCDEDPDACCDLVGCISPELPRGSPYFECVACNSCMVWCLPCGATFEPIHS